MPRVPPLLLFAALAPAVPVSAADGRLVRAADETLVLHVVDDETGAELEGVTLAIMLHPIIPVRPLEAGEARGADGATVGPFRSPVTITLAKETERTRGDRLYVRAAGHVPDAIEVDWSAASERTLRLARRAEIRVNVEGWEMPRLEPPGDMSPQMFEVTVRPHLAIRSLADVEGDGGFGSPRQRPPIVDELLAAAPPASIPAELHADFLASLRLRAAQVMAEMHEVVRGAPLDDEGAGVLEGIPPGRWLVSLDVHAPFDDEIDNRVHRFEWMTGEGRPLAAEVIDVVATQPNLLTLRVPRPRTDEPGSVTLRFRDELTGATVALDPDAVQLRPLLRDDERPKVDDEAALHKWFDPFTERREGDDLVVRGPTSYASLSASRHGAPWFEPLQTWVNVTGEPAVVEFPLVRATGLLVHWRGEHGPIDRATLGFKEQMSLLKDVSFLPAEGEAAAVKRLDHGDFTLFCAPRAGRWILKLPIAPLFSDPAAREFELPDRSVVETIVELRPAPK